GTGRSATRVRPSSSSTTCRSSNSSAGPWRREYSLKSRNSAEEEPQSLLELEPWLTRIRDADWQVERGVQDDRAYYFGRRSALADVYRQLQRLLGWPDPLTGPPPRGASHALSSLPEPRRSPTPTPATRLTSALSTPMPGQPF